MADHQKEMDTKASPGPMPEGWVLRTKLEDDGTEVKCYLCPATEQEFYSYEDLMRYVRYAKANKLSIYDPNFEAILKKPEGYVRAKEERQQSRTLEKKTEGKNKRAV